MMFSAPSFVAGPLGLSAVALTSDLTANLLKTIAAKTSADHTWIVGDIIACQGMSSKGAGIILEAPHIEDLLTPHYDEETTRVFMSALTEGKLQGCSYDRTTGSFKPCRNFPEGYKLETSSRSEPKPRRERKRKPAPLPQPKSEPKPAPQAQPAPEPKPTPQPQPKSEPISKAPITPSPLSEAEAEIVADLYGPEKEIAAHIGHTVLPLTRPDIPVQMLCHIAKRHFDRAIFLAVGARRYPRGEMIPIKEGQEIYLTAGPHFKTGDRIEECLFVSVERPMSRTAQDYPKIKLRYHKGYWVILNRQIAGHNATDLVHALLTLTNWGIRHDGRKFRQSTNRHVLPPEEEALREVILAMTDKIIKLRK